jgi:hypothetical protein
LDDAASIVFGRGEGHISGHGGDAQQVKVFRAGQGKEEGDGVIYPRVAVNN